MFEANPVIKHVRKAPTYRLRMTGKICWCSFTLRLKIIHFLSANEPSIVTIGVHCLERVR